MIAIKTARSFLASAPREAAADALGVCAIALSVFAGFLLPGLF
ncbi:MAG: hypothetical protein AAGC57_10770 [Pseudomonadota bacterium]